MADQHLTILRRNQLFKQYLGHLEASQFSGVQTQSACLVCAVGGGDSDLAFGIADFLADERTPAFTAQMNE